MLVATRGALKGTVISDFREYIIIPIFFRKQIESFVEKATFDSSLCLIFGDEKENYRIVKSVKPIAFPEGGYNSDTLESQIEEVINSTNISLIGYAYSGQLFSRIGLPIPKGHQGTLSFIQLKVLNKVTQDWTSWITKDCNTSVEKQKVIL